MCKSGDRDRNWSIGRREAKGDGRKGEGQVEGFQEPEGRGKERDLKKKREREKRDRKKVKAETKSGFPICKKQRFKL